MAKSRCETTRKRRSRRQSGIRRKRPVLRRTRYSYRVGGGQKNQSFVARYWQMGKRLPCLR